MYEICCFNLLIKAQKILMFTPWSLKENIVNRIKVHFNCIFRNKLSFEMLVTFEKVSENSDFIVSG